MSEDDAFMALAAGAAAMYRLFTSLTAAGFTEEQAMKLTLGIVMETLKQGQAQ